MNLKEMVGQYTSHAGFATTQQVFKEADDNTLRFADTLLSAGIGDKATARPFALIYASKRYGVELIASERAPFFTVPQNTAAIKAVSRVLSACFPSVDTDVWGHNKRKASSSKASLVDKAVALWAQMSDAEKARFNKTVGRK